MEKYFNIAGPCNPAQHYMVPALERLPEVSRLVSRGQTFVVHAARQSGKTTALLALVADINSRGEMRALYFSLESAQRFSNPKDGIPMIVERMRSALASHRVFSEWAKSVSDERMDVREFLSAAARASDRPLAVFFDEVDCLSDDTLITFLRQLRDGIVTSRAPDPDIALPFPVAIALVGMRDELANAIELILSEKLEQYNIEVVSTSIEDMDFTDAFTDAVEAKQVAQQNKLKAQTEAEQRVIEANAAAEVKKVQADAEAYEVLARADAEAEANRKISESLTRDLIDYNYAQSWDGKLPMMMSGSDGAVIVNAGDLIDGD